MPPATVAYGALVGHTAIVVAFFTGVGFVGYMADRSGAVAHATPAAGQLLQLYGSALVLEWAAVFYVWRGTRSHVSLIDLVGRSSRTSRNVLTDIVLAAAVRATWLGIQSIFPATAAAAALLPRNAAEKLVWVLVAISAGFCEELVFRGYLQRQFHAFTGSLPAAITLQAAVFGIGHFYEGPWPVMKIVIYGILFGAVAAWRKDLRPGMIAHAWSDLYGVI